MKTSVKNSNVLLKTPLIMEDKSKSDTILEQSTKMKNRMSIFIQWVSCKRIWKEHYLYTKKRLKPVREKTIFLILTERRDRWNTMRFENFI